MLLSLKSHCLDVLLVALLLVEQVARLEEVTAKKEAQQKQHDDLR